MPQYGGVIAGPPAKNILSDAVEALNIQKPKGGMEKKYQYTDKKYTTVPNFVGMTIKEAKELVTKVNIEIEGSGNQVIYQSPDAGSHIYEGEVVRLFTN